MLTWLKNLVYRKLSARRSVHIERLGNTIALHLNGFKPAQIQEIAKKCHDAGLRVVSASPALQSVILQYPQPQEKEKFFQTIWSIIADYFSIIDEEISKLQI